MEYKYQQRRNFKFIEELKLRATPTELIVYKWLQFNNKRFIFQKGFFSPFHRIVDFYIPGKKIIIEIDGGYHKNPAETMKDRWKDKRFLEARGMKTIRIKNEEVLDGSFVNKLSTYYHLQSISICDTIHE